MNHCSKCGEAPCTWKVLAEAVIDETEEHFADDEDSPNNVKRKFAFGTYVRYKHGVLGRGVRVKNPPCVEIGVHGHFPENSGVYMGHRAT